MLSYAKQYSLLIQAARVDISRLPDRDHAEHRIFAKCQSESKGRSRDDRPSNLVLLLHQEHYEAHRLLHLMHPEHAGLSYAWWQMCHKSGVKVSVNEYAEARTEYSDKHPSKTPKGKALAKRLKAELEQL